jgi:hypothetical protein
MNDLTPFEREIKQTYHLLNANPAFFNHLEATLKAHKPNPEVKTKPTFHVARDWAYAMATFLLIGVMILTIGPSKVLAQIKTAFGFVPGVGLVGTSSPFRQLAEPVSDTRDGVILTIQSAFLSADQTNINYTMSDLPAELKPSGFGHPECFTPAYLALPDGGKVEASGSSGGLAPDGAFVHEIRFSGPFPANFNEATLVFPCLVGTAQGEGPADWQIPLTFKPVPENIVVYPATLIPPQAAKIETPVSATEGPTGRTNAAPIAPAMPAMIVNGDRQGEMVVLGVVEKPDAYWVTWAYPFRNDEAIQVNGHLYVSPFNPVLYDANGVELPQPDHETRLELWGFEEGLRNQLSGQDRLKYGMTMSTFAVPKSGIAFPVYARQNVYERSFPEKETYTDIEFDGAEVQTSDGPIEINRDIQLGPVKFELKAIEKDSRGGYTFLFDGTTGKVIECRVNLVGYPTNMSGGSGFDPDAPFHFRQSVMYQQIPTGKLTVRVSQPAVLGDLISFIGSWSPEK